MTVVSMLSGALLFHFGMHAGNSIHGFHGAHILAVTAFYAVKLMDGVFFFPGAANAAHRALTGTERTSDAA